MTSPPLHFLLLGAALLCGDRWLRAGPTAAAEAVSRTITITRADRQRLRAEWAQERGRSPSDDEEHALVRQAIDDEVLLREAMARGLDRDDRVVRTRLAQLAEFVGADGDESALVDEARRLGLDRSDLVVRRRLVQTMRLIAARPTRGDVPTEADVLAWYEAHREQLRQPPRISLTHVYFGRARRGTSLVGDAARTLARLRRLNVGPDQAERVGDPFIRGAEMPSSTPEELTRAFGPGFAESVEVLPEGTWSDPIESAYGLHLVWVRERTPSAVPPLSAVRNRVVHGLLQERRDARLERRLREWRRRYVVVVEGDRA